MARKKFFRFRIRRPAIGKREFKKRLGIFIIIFVVLLAALLLPRVSPLRRGISRVGSSVGGPAYIVKRFYIAANHGRYKEAISYMSSNAKSYFFMSDSEYSTLASISRKGKKIRNLITTSQKVYSTKAYVTIRINYMDGVSLSKSATLIKERGAWKISGE